MNIRNSLIITAVVILTAACAKDNQSSQFDQAPNLPIVESMVMPFGILNELDTTKLTEEGQVENRASFKNWTYAAVHLYVWNTIVISELAIPVATLAEAFNHDPQVDGEYYVWSYDIEDNNAHYFLQLFAKLADNQEEIEWEMVVDLEGKYSGFTYYTGLTNLDNTSASWTIFGAPQNPFPFLQIDYNVDDNDATIRYTNVIPGHQDSGNYIEARSTVSGEMNRQYDINKGSADDFLRIRWNEPNHNGQVSEVNNFGDNNWHCWDEKGRDTSCN